jgi:hypothetical protein
MKPLAHSAALTQHPLTCQARIIRLDFDAKMPGCLEALRDFTSLVRCTRSVIMPTWHDWRCPLVGMTLIGSSRVFSSRGVAVSCLRVAVQFVRWQGYDL